MESSIAVFLFRQLAREPMPTIRKFSGVDGQRIRKCLLMVCLGLVENGTDLGDAARECHIYT